ncbi:MAG: cellulase family glycosylhydrolase [Prevotellaceae bacterium]|jgi:aryl-phospho-beta-D-glucosidase BglC (GH1 family)|nr:cellulase family glycosylhydrolase [Prevotellaceae bacterium]
MKLSPKNCILAAILLPFLTLACGGSNPDNTEPDPVVPETPVDPEPSDPPVTIVPDVTPDNTGMESNASALAAKITIGWNLYNTLEATGGETAWGNPPTTQALIDAVKQAGFNAIRIPCAWNAYATGSDYTIDAKWMARVKEVVDYCMNANLYTIINIHWDGGWLEENCTPDKQDVNNRKQKAYWTQIATTFRNYDERLLFAGCNEPNVTDAAQMVVLKSYEQTFVDAVRTTGGKNYYRTLIVQGPNTDIDKTDALLGEMPADVVPNRLMAEVHYYAPWQFCGLTEDADWGRMFYFWGAAYHIPGSDRNATLQEEDYLMQQFAKVKAQFTDKGIPVVLGEYGAVDRLTLTGKELETHLASRAYFNEIVTREAKNHGMVPFCWNMGTPLIDRTSCTVADTQLLQALMRGATDGKYPY